MANRPLLSYGLAAMQACGVEDVAVIVSPGTAADVRDLLAASADGALRIGCIDAGEPQGLVHALRAATHFLDDRPVMVHLGDALVSQPLDAAVRRARRTAARTRCCWCATRPSSAASRRARACGRCGSSQDKPVPPAEQALAGVFVLGPAAIDAALALPDEAGVAEIVRAIGESGGRLETRIVNGSWKYTGEVDGLLAANRMVLDEIESEVAGCDLSQARIEGRVHIHPTAIIERSTIRGPAVIGPRAVLQDAFVGPYSAVGTEVRLEGAELEHSIVLDHAVIRHIGHRLEDSLVGSGATVTRDFAFPSGLRLRVGRRAEVLLRLGRRTPHAAVPPEEPLGADPRATRPRAGADRARGRGAARARRRALGGGARGRADPRSSRGSSQEPHADLARSRARPRAGRRLGIVPGPRCPRLAREPDGASTWAPRSGSTRATRCGPPSCSTLQGVYPTAAGGARGARRGGPALRDRLQRGQDARRRDGKLQGRLLRMVGGHFTKRMAGKLIPVRRLADHGGPERRTRWRSWVETGTIRFYGG